MFHQENVTSIQTLNVILIALSVTFQTLVLNAKLGIIYHLQIVIYVLQTVITVMFITLVIHVHLGIVLITQDIVILIQLLKESLMPLLLSLY
jgi:hypothetical protein